MISITHKVVFILILLFCIAGCVFENDDPILDTFPSPIKISPDSVLDLEENGLLMPIDIARKDSLFLLRVDKKDYAVYILKEKTGEMIPCFRIGRGPQETIRPERLFQLVGDSLFLYDIALKRYYGMSVSNTVSKRKSDVSLLHQFPLSDDIGQSRPYVIHETDSGRIATGIFNNGIWFGFIDDYGHVKEGIKYVDFKALQEASDIERAAFHSATHITSSPNGKHVACALDAAPALSICEIINPSILSETKRIVCGEPDISFPEGASAVAYSPNNKWAFCHLESDNSYIYILYSGRPFNDPIPSWECFELLVYDWTGVPITRYHLTESISSFCIENQTLYGISSYPESKILIYNLGNL